MTSDNNYIDNEEKFDKLKIFILGDSCTATLSISNFFSALGFKTIHYYVAESNQIPHNENNRLDNVYNILSYIENSGANCFSDYPTRLFFRELSEAYPNAYFILTYRNDIEAWKASMSKFFQKINISINIDELSISYETLNNDIRCFFKKNINYNFLEICCDENSIINSEKIKSFINIESSAVLTYENHSNDIDKSIISNRINFIQINSGIDIEKISFNRADFKGLLSEFGWIFLINDSNQYMEYLYGRKFWDVEELAKCDLVFKGRNELFNTTDFQYFKFIVPEKAVIYKEYLPKSIAKLEQNYRRPAKILDEKFKPVVSYLDQYLIDAKSYGFLYFRGDTHPNWLGGYFIYQYIIKHINENSDGSLTMPIPLSNLRPSLAGYDGDLFSQITPNENLTLNNQLADVNHQNIFEYLIRYEVPKESQSARTVSSDGYLNNRIFSRGVIIKVSDDLSLPTAVIFRDSTADFMIDLLAEHFRRVVFVWHQGQIISEVLDAEKPDFIIHVMAERFVTAYGQTLPVTVSG